MVHKFTLRCLKQLERMNQYRLINCHSVVSSNQPIWYYQSAVFNALLSHYMPIEIKNNCVETYKMKKVVKENIGFETRNTMKYIRYTVTEYSLYRYTDCRAGAIFLCFI